MDMELLQRVDQDPEAREKGRSAFIRSAIELYLRVRERQTIDDRIAAAYDGQADAMLEEVSEMMEMQAWPSD